jgi:hypothetical protein
VRLSFKESRMRFVDPTKPYRKSGRMGHPAFFPDDQRKFFFDLAQLRFRECI